MNRCIIFDLDETIGFFSQIYIIINKYESVNNVTISDELYEKIFTRFNKVFRPGIFVLLAYINTLKKKYAITTLLYTNTIMSDKFIKLIIKYINIRLHLNRNFFDEIITLNAKGRISCKKQFNDIISCVNYLNNGYIFLVIDNYYHINLDKIYSNVIKITGYKYYYISSDIWKYICNNNYNEKCDTIINDIIVDREKNIEIYEKSRKDTICLFNIVNKFININNI